MEWAKTSPRERTEILRRAYDLIMVRQDELALVMTTEMGKPFAEAKGEVAYAAEFFRWFSEEAVRIGGVCCRVCYSLLCSLPPFGDSRKLGIVTASLPSLNDDLLREAGVLDPSRIVMGDLGDKPALKSAWMDQTSVEDIPMIEQETLEVTRELVTTHPEVALILLECTGLPIFGASIQKAVGIPVLDIVSLVDMFAQGFTPGERILI